MAKIKSVLLFPKEETAFGGEDDPKGDFPSPIVAAAIAVDSRGGGGDGDGGGGKAAGVGLANGGVGVTTFLNLH